MPVRKTRRGLCADAASGSAAASAFPDIYEHSGAIVKLSPDGTADLATAAMDIGSGQNHHAAANRGRGAGADDGPGAHDAGRRHDQRALRRADAREPGDLQRRELRCWQPREAAKERLLEVAGIMLEVSPEDLELADGRVAVKGAPGQIPDRG